jgi:hypothetical protein
MKVLFVVLAILFLSSCSDSDKKYLTVEETARQCRVCDSSGLFFRVNYNYSGTHAVSVVCNDNRWDAVERKAVYAKIKQNSIANKDSSK